MKNEDTAIGLFQDMFPKNMMTFNPGWNQDAGELESFDDVRDIQRSLKKADIEITGSGNASVHVLELLKVRITGSGDVFYKGFPELDIDISGSGDVRDAN